MFAAVMMFIVGCHNIIYGISLLNDYRVIVNNLATGELNIIYADTTFWGWLWVAIGIAEVFAAIGITSGNQAARWFGVTVAAMNAIGQLAVLAAFPFWSFTIIALDVLVIYGLLTHWPRQPGTYEPYPGDEQRVEAGRTEAGRAGAGYGYGTGGTRPSDETVVRTGRRERPERPPTQ
jgi:hypothetical protein